MSAANTGGIAHQNGNNLMSAIVSDGTNSNKAKAIRILLVLLPKLANLSALVTKI